MYRGSWESLTLKAMQFKKRENILLAFHSTLLAFPFSISHLHILKLYLLSLFYAHITLSSLLNITLGFPLVVGASTALSFVLLLLPPLTLDVIVMCDPSGSRARWSSHRVYSTSPPSLGWELASKQI